MGKLKSTHQESDLAYDIPTCPICGENKRLMVDMCDKKWLMPRMCKCRREEIEKRDRVDKVREKQIRLQQIFTNSLMTKEFRSLSFSSWDHNIGSEFLYGIGHKYVKNFKSIKEKNIGLLIYGAPGSGKTFLSGCIANALIEDYTPVICISAIGILERIKSSFTNYGDNGVSDILNSLSNADLLILDDLGTENNTSWSRATMYQIIDARYRSKKPLIVTTNLSLKELQGRYDDEGAMGRTYDRLVNEMCTPIESKWHSIRREKGREKANILREIIL